MMKLGFAKSAVLFLLTGIFMSGHATDLKTVIKKSGFYEIKAVSNGNSTDKNFTLTVGQRKTYSSVLTDEIIPLGFLPAGAAVDTKTVAPATLSIVQKEVETVKSARIDVKTGTTVLHEVKQVGFYGLANAAFSGKKNGSGLDVRVLVRKQSPLLRQQVQAGKTISLDTEIGWLQPGDVIELEVVGEGSANAILAYDVLFLAQTDIQTQIEQAVSRKEPIAYIYPGRYYVRPDRKAGIFLHDLSDLTVHAYGVEMILRRTSQRILDVQRCTNVAVKGFVADNDPLLFPQGTVVAVAENGTWIDIELHEGYPVPTGKAADRAMVHDPATLYRKKLAKDLNPTSVEQLDSTIYRVSIGARNLRDHGWALGDYVSLTNPGAGGSCFIYESTRFKLEDVTLYSCARHFSIFEKYASENVYRNVAIKPGPRPLLASINRLRSTHSDGIHSKYATIGPRIEDCHFEALGDDAVAINGSFSIVMENSGGNTVKVAAHEESLRVGDRIRFYTSSGEIQYRKIIGATSVRVEDPAAMRAFVVKHYPRLKFPGGYKYVTSLELDSVTHVSEGNLLANMDRNGNGFTVRNSRIKNGRARGILIKASDGVVEGNHISHLALPGIILAAEATAFIESDMVSDVVVRNNIIESVKESALNPEGKIQAGGLVVVFANQTIKGHHRIRIEGNQFINIPGVNIQVSNATDVKVDRNVFIRSHHEESLAGKNVGVDNSALIWMDYVDGVTLGAGKDANVYQNIGKYADKAHLVRFTENAEHVKGEVYPK